MTKHKPKSLDDRGCVGYLLDIDIWQKRDYPYHARRCRCQRTCTEASRSGKVPHQS